MDWSLVLMIILLVLGGMLYQSQSKLKNKMLCYFIRPNRTRIERWVPLYSKHIIFDRGRYGKGHYIVDPECITMQWYERGINKLFPTQVPTLEFKWDTPNPLNPTSFESTWHTPEARNAAWEEHQHIAFARAAAVQAGKKSRFPEWFFPLITIALVLIVGYLSFTNGNAAVERLDYMQQQINLLK